MQLDTMNNKPQQFVFPQIGTKLQQGSSSSSSFSMGHPAAQHGKQASVDPEMSKAEKRGYEKGYAEGLKTGTEQGQGEKFQLENQLNNNCAGIATALDNITKTLDKLAKEKHVLALKLSCLIAEKIARSAMEKDFSANIKDFIDKAFPHIFNEKSILIKVNSKLADQLKEKIQSTISEKGFTGEITLIGEDRIPESACEIDWDTGGVDYNPERAWDEVYKILGIEKPAQTAQAEISPAPSASDENNTNNENLQEETKS